MHASPFSFEFTRRVCLLSLIARCSSSLPLGCLYRGQGAQPVGAAGAYVEAGREVFERTSESHAIVKAPGAGDDDSGGGTVAEAVEPQVEGTTYEVLHPACVAWVLHAIHPPSQH